MANPEHLKILKQGVEVWNNWRDEDPGIKPNLTGAKLGGFNLAGVNFVETFLVHTNLAGADLSDSNVQEAWLVGANLTAVNFARSDLTGGDFAYSKLIDANLTEVSLEHANLAGADLTNADLTGAHLWETGFINVDLSKTKGLLDCDHLGPSPIDHRTLQMSGGLPVQFLRGCGLPLEIIDVIPGLHGEPTRFYSCFISHSSEDREFVVMLYADLTKNGVACKMVPYDIKTGHKIRAWVESAIWTQDKTLVVLSRGSLASMWVGNEVESAFERERKEEIDIVMPIKIDNSLDVTEVPWASTLRRQVECGDFTNWKDPDSYQQSFDKLLRDLEAG